MCVTTACENAYLAGLMHEVYGHDLSNISRRRIVLYSPYYDDQMDALICCGPN